jgi:hypothetical protein
MSQWTDQDVLTVEEAAAYMRIGVSTLYRQLVLDASCPDRVPSVRVGRRRLIVFWQLRAWMAAQAGMPAPLATLPLRQH